MFDSKAPSSLGEALALATMELEIKAREQSYAAATNIVQNVITRYGSHEVPQGIIYWTGWADGIYAKIRRDQKEMNERK